MHEKFPLILTSGRLVEYEGGGEETRAEITDPRVYRLRLSMLFGIDLSPEEVAALGVFPNPPA